MDNIILHYITLYHIIVYYILNKRYCFYRNKIVIGKFKLLKFDKLPSRHVRALSALMFKETPALKHIKLIFTFHVEHTRYNHSASESMALYKAPLKQRIPLTKVMSLPFLFSSTDKFHVIMV